MQNQTALLYNPDAIVLMDLESVLVELGFTCTTTLIPPEPPKRAYTLAVLHLDRAIHDLIGGLVAVGTGVIVVSSHERPDLPQGARLLESPFLSDDLRAMVDLFAPLPQHRTSSVDVQKRIQARKLMAPYAKRLLAWHAKVAHLRAMGTSRHTTPDEWPSLAAEAGGLRDEVRRTHVEMQAATRGYPAHDAFDDVEIGLLKVMKDLEELSALDPDRQMARARREEP